jgi:hypothetical protein
VAGSVCSQSLPHPPPFDLGHFADGFWQRILLGLQVLLRLATSASYPSFNYSILSCTDCSNGLQHSLQPSLFLVAYSTHFYPILAFYSLHNLFYPLFGVGHHLLAHKYSACPPRVTRYAEYKPRFQFKSLRDLRISTIIRPEERTILD